MLVNRPLNLAPLAGLQCVERHLVQRDDNVDILNLQEVGEARDTLHMEARFLPATFVALQRKGHPVSRWSAWNEQAGHAHGILIVVPVHAGTLRIFTTRWSASTRPNSNSSAL